MKIYEIIDSDNFDHIECINDNATDHDWDELKSNHPEYHDSTACCKEGDVAIELCQQTDYSWESYIFLFTDRDINEDGDDREDLANIHYTITGPKSATFEINGNEIVCITTGKFKTVNGLDETIEEYEKTRVAYKFKINTTDKGNYYFEAGAYVGSGYIPPFPKRKLVEKTKQFLRHQSFVPPADVIYIAAGLSYTEIVELLQ